MQSIDIIIGMLGSTIRLSIPLIFTALAGLFSERSGIFDIGLEGKMLASAFAAAVVAYYTGSPWLGLLGGILISIVFSLVHGYASITARGNQIVSGVALNFVAAGLTVVLGNAWFRQGGRTPQLENSARFTGIDFPGAEAASQMGFFGKLYVLRAAYEGGLVWLAVAGVIASVIGAFYYLRIVFYMYFGEEQEPLETGKSPVQWGFLMASAAIMLLGIVNMFGVETMAQAAAATLVN